MTSQVEGFSYEFENTNPNTFLHFTLSCDRCKKAIMIIENGQSIIKRRLCYPCYKELLMKN